MSITAYVQGSKDPASPGRLTEDSTITIEGATYDIPERGWYGPDRKPSRAAPHRISAALESADYQRAYSDLSGPDENGVFEIQVVKA